MYEETRTETVGEDGMVHLALPDLRPGQTIEVTVRDGLLTGSARSAPVSGKPDEFGRFRRVGRLKELVTTSSDFDDPLPEMEPYS